MSKRKSTTASKRARRPKIAARAQRSKQAIVKSPKNGPQPPVAGGSTRSPSEVHDDPNCEAPLAETAAALKNGFGEKRENDATGNMRAYQAKLLELAQANMEFAFEFGPRLAKIRSPFEFFALIAEFTSKRIGMFQKYSEEMAAYSIWRIKTLSEHTALPGR